MDTEFVTPVVPTEPVATTPDKATVRLELTVPTEPVADTPLSGWTRLAAIVPTIPAVVTRW